MNIIGQPISLQLVANENQEKDVDIKDIKWTIRQGIAVDKNGEIKEEVCYFFRWIRRNDHGRLPSVNP